LIPRALVSERGFGPAIVSAGTSRRACSSKRFAIDSYEMPPKGQTLRCRDRGRFERWSKWAAAYVAGSDSPGNPNAAPNSIWLKRKSEHWRGKPVSATGVAHRAIARICPGAGLGHFMPFPLEAAGLGTRRRRDPCGARAPIVFRLDRFFRHTAAVGRRVMDDLRTR